MKGAMKENIGSGQENTNEVLSKCEIGSKEYTSFELVDRYEENGFDDWYVPSILELHEIYDALGELEMSTHAGYYDKYFWSSTNENSTYAHSRNLVNGHKVYAKKELALSILPIRSF
ncbi:hypothetical protein BPLS_P0991 [Bathymodiolus platifrons methanotrophic gill symbiont]|nr:hypothetical protein BPLS_P0991 [Bathymodiolus platifrons methanotrophic gill symbiont]